MVYVGATFGKGVGTSDRDGLNEYLVNTRSVMLRGSQGLISPRYLSEQSRVAE